MSEVANIGPGGVRSRWVGGVLMLGVAIAGAIYLHESGRDPLWRLLLFVPLFDHISTYDVVFVELVLALGFGLVVLGAVLISTDGPGLPFLSTHRLFVISVLSYSLYLTHMVFMGNTYRALDGVLGFSTWPGVFQYVVYLPAFVFFSLITALALHFFAERPGLRLKDAI